MSLPKFNLDKLRESVSQQQAATKKDIANLLLLDRLQAQISREKGEYKGEDINLPELDTDKVRVFLEFTSNDGKPIRHIDLKVLRYPTSSGASAKKWYAKYNSYFSGKVGYVETPLDVLFQNYDPVVEASDFHRNQYNFWKNYINFDTSGLLHKREGDPTQKFLKFGRDRVYAVYDIDFPENEYERYHKIHDEEKWGRHLFNDIDNDLQQMVTGNNIVNAADENFMSDSVAAFEPLFANLDMNLQKIQINTGDEIVEITNG